MLIFIVGCAATILSAGPHPVQAAYLWRHRSDRAVFRGVSLAGVGVISVTSILWAAYGLRFDAPWVATIAAIDLLMQFGVLVIAVRYRHGFGASAVALYAGCVVAAIVAALLLPQNILGAVGACTALAMFVPQARRVAKARGTAAGRAFNPVSSVLNIAADSLWFAYGVLLNDVWLAIPAPFVVACSLLMLWAWAGSRGERVAVSITEAEYTLAPTRAPEDDRSA